MVDMAVLFSGREMPYATLMHIEETNFLATTPANAQSSRAKMIVAESLPKRSGQWHRPRRAMCSVMIGRPDAKSPAKIISVGMSTNTTGSKVKTSGDGVAITESAAELKIETRLLLCVSGHKCLVNRVDQSALFSDERKHLQ